MMHIIQSIKTAYQRSIVQAGRARVRRELLSLSDRALADSGFSRELLEAGVSAWPWRIAEDLEPINFAALAQTQQPAYAVPKKNQYRQAVAELKAYSDLELADLGLARSQIEYAVRHGRPGLDNIDGDFQRAA
jgi:uncharacterized protein YjiS (DUF1127 family)